MLKLKRALGLAVVTGVAVIGGCQAPPPDKTLGTPLEPTIMHRFYEPMIDNAVAHDMSVADVHFVPHTVELNDLGVRRVDRLMKVLDRYGGIVRYETLSTNEDMIDGRLASVERYLATSGLDMTRVEVLSRMSGGRGTAATRATLAEQKLEASIQAGTLESSSSGSQ